jgi:hypothetical protein
MPRRALFVDGASGRFAFSRSRVHPAYSPPRCSNQLGRLIAIAVATAAAVFTLGVVLMEAR